MRGTHVNQLATVKQTAPTSSSHFACPRKG